MNSALCDRRTRKCKNSRTDSSAFSAFRYSGACYLCSSRERIVRTSGDTMSSHASPKRLSRRCRLTRHVKRCNRPRRPIYSRRSDVERSLFRRFFSFISSFSSFICWRFISVKLRLINRASALLSALHTHHHTLLFHRLKL